MIDDRTPNLDLPLPNVENVTTDDIQRLRDALGELDAAVAARQLSAQKGAANGYAGLDSSGKVPASQLPSFVDDVLEFANFAALPVTGETGKIYVTLDTNRTYRWGGSAYTEISASPGSTDAVPEGASNLYFTAQRVREAVLTGLSTATNAAITAADTVLSAMGKLQKQITDHFGAGGTVHAAATGSAAGFMSAADKVALDALNAKASAFAPVGSVLPYSLSTAPAGWAMCYGQVLLSSNTDAAALRAALIADGFPYGQDGSGNPKVPDMRGRVAAGKDDMGGTAASRLTSAGSGVAGTTLGATGGAETHTLTAAQIPPHTHPIASNSSRNTTSGGSDNVAMGGASTLNTGSNTGGGGAHNNTQPTIILNAIIKL